MAQVIYYSSMKAGKHPVETLAAIDAYDCSTRWGGLGKVHVDAVPAETALDWDNMLEDYTGDPTEVQETAVATLMQICGAAVHMDYANSANGGSSASTSLVPSALVTYFGYDGTVRKMSRDAYTLATWTEIIYDELAAERPVLYDGQSSGGGHAFVVDGYDGDELFHVNWGWGGSQDNYFALSVMNPGDNSGIGASTSNDGYSFGQEAVIGIQIGSGQTYSEPKKMTFKELSISGNAIHTKVRNYNNETLTFDYGFGYIDESGNVEQFGVQTCQFEYMYGINNFYTNINGTDKPAGTYKIVRISRLNGTTDWVVQDDEYVEAVFDGSSVTLTKHPVVSLEAQPFNFTGTKYVNEVQPIEVAIKNNGDEFYGTLFLFASKTETKGEYINLGGVTITKGNTATLTFEFEPTSTGTYNIWVATDSEGSNVIGTSTVVITEAPSSGETSSNVDLTFTQVVLNAETSNVVGKIAKVKVSVTNSTDVNFQGSIGLFTWKWNGGSGSANVSGKTVVVPAHSAVDVDFESEELTGADRYSFTVYYYKGETQTVDQTKIYDYYTPIDGYTTYDANGNAVLKKAEESITVDANVAYVDLCGQTTTNTITSQANPNTLFLVDEGFSLTGATNVIEKTSSGYQASNIVLQDNEKGFVSPVDFTATKMTYTRTFDKFYDNGKNWTTIVLPFAVSKVTVTNTSGVLPWDEANRKFWLMEFSGESGSTVNFTTAPTP